MAAAAAVLVAAGVVLAVVLLHDGDDGGPVRSTDRNVLSFPRRAGTIFSYGVAVVVNTGDRVAVLRRATLAEPSEGLETLAVRVGGPKRRFALVSGDVRWPPREAPQQDLRPLEGFRLATADEPHTDPGAELLFALRVRRPGRYTTKGVQLEYTVGDRRYTQLVPTALAVCATARRPPPGPKCPLPAVPEDGPVLQPQTVTFGPAGAPEGP